MSEKIVAAPSSGIELADEERTRCECWTRVMGYHRPVHYFNTGKKGEFEERVCFSEKPEGRGTFHERKSTACR